MLIAIGVVPGESGEDAIALGALLCAAFDAEAMLVHIFPAAYDYVSHGNVDAEWEAYLRTESRRMIDDALEDAEEYGLTAPRTMIHGHRSSGVGLNEVAEAEHADMIVIGSAPGGSTGRFQIGSTADQLLHGSQVPVALAPATFRRMHPEAFGRLVVAFQDTDESRNAAMSAATWAQQVHVPLSLLTVLMRHRIYGSQLGREGENEVMTQLMADTRTKQRETLDALPGDVEADGQITIGDSPIEAVRRHDWDGNELFVLASSSGGVIRRVFLGDMTYKLLRATPVPAVVLPRHT